MCRNHLCIGRNIMKSNDNIYSIRSAAGIVISFFTPGHGGGSSRSGAAAMLAGVLVSFLLFGCLADVTSIVAPSMTATGRVMTFTVNGMLISGGATGHAGIVLQIPSGTQVLRAHYEASGGTEGMMSGELSANSWIATGYTAEPGYQLYAGTGGGFLESPGTYTVSVKVWLLVPDTVLPGTYRIKASVGTVEINPGTMESHWTQVSPSNNGVAVFNFSQISGKYVSNPVTIESGTPDTLPPADVLPVVTPGYRNDRTKARFTVDFSGYDEQAQGDVIKYRIYFSRNAFSGVDGAQMLTNQTLPSISCSGGICTLSTEIWSVLYYIEVPPGSEVPTIIDGLALGVPYHFAVTAEDRRRETREQSRPGDGGRWRPAFSPAPF